MSAVSPFSYSSIKFRKYKLLVRSQDSSVCIATSYRLESSGLDFRQGQESFLFQKRSDWLGGPPSLMFKVYWGQSGQGMMGNTHLHLVPKLRMTGAKHLLPLPAFIACTETASTFYLFKPLVNADSPSCSAVGNNLFVTTQHNAGVTYFTRYILYTLHTAHLTYCTPYIPQTLHTAHPTYCTP
jgi:hypothetical protein